MNGYTTVYKTAEGREKLRRFFFSLSGDGVGASPLTETLNRRESRRNLTAESCRVGSPLHYTTTTNVNVTLDGQTNAKIRNHE